ncbi:hypothetical protein [Oecophyllibacter saccharovorans]|uniref:hypothetical protein n=1 Tax=Oecophyllibacter saccharovorans TaxID=2558360 RepID=UPI001E28F101|nr:hypothetical protein [Oecophyllibacter saccharovorans]
MKENLAGIEAGGEGNPAFGAVPPPPPVSRALMGAVIFMGVLLVVGTVALLWVIVSRRLHPAPPPVSPTPSLVAPATGGQAFNGSASARLNLPLRNGEQVQNLTSRPDGAVLVLIRGPQGGRILLWQPETARLLAELVLPAASPPAPSYPNASP